MRTLLSFGSTRGKPEGLATARPDGLRRATLAVNARMLLGMGGVLTPFALYALIHGEVLPAILVALALACSLATMMLQRRGAHDAAVSVQIYSIVAAGALLTVADPAIADFGLAVALMAPIHASLLSGHRMKVHAWVLVGVAACLGLGSAIGAITWPDAFGQSFRLAGGIAFAVTAMVVAHTANRLNTAFEVYDRAQIKAFRHLLEHVHDAVMRFSTEGELLFASRSSETLFGCKRYELEGDGLLERIHVLDRPIYLTAFSDANRSGRAATIEIRIRHDASTVSAAPRFVWMEIALSPVVDSDVQPRNEVVAVFRDVTERRDQDNTMRAARKAAEEASEAKSRFLASIGHELRTPLNAIIGFSEMMTSNIGGELTPTHREYAELIHRSGTHLVGVVGMLLDMSRIEAGKFELQTDSFAPADLVEPCFHMVDALARAKQIQFAANLPANLPQITADERACRQILINLLSNAIKFSYERGVVSVTMKRQGNSFAISVSDRGIGMGPDAVARIGEPFFQAQEGLSRRYEGTGLGLSIVKGLVDLHQGTLRVNSEPGIGTDVTVTLPINGPETKMRETSSVTPLRREVVPQPEAQWPEQKRNAK